MVASRAVQTAGMMVALWAMTKVEWMVDEMVFQKVVQLEMMA